MGRLAPFVESQVQELRRCRDLSFTVDGFTSATGNPELQDRLTVGVPCSSGRVQWHVLFDASRPNDAPDVIFGEHDEGFTPLVPDTDAHSPAPAPGRVSEWGLLREWRGEDTSRLLKLLLDLRKQYLLYQWSVAESVPDERVRFEVSTVAHTPGSEVLVSLSGPWGDRQVEGVELSVPVQGVDLSGLRPFLGYSALFEGQLSSQICLQLRFSGRRTVTDGQRGGPQPQRRLHLPPLLDCLLSLHDLKLPAWTDSMCTIEYEHLVKELLRSKVVEAVVGLEARAGLMVALGKLMGPLRETDTVRFLRTTVVLRLGSFEFLVHVLLSPRFPLSQPFLQLQSCQQFDHQGRPIFSQVCDSFPWSPRWNPPEMAQRIGAFLLEEAARFKALCQ